MPSSSIYQCNVYLGLDVVKASDVIYGGYFEHRLLSSAQLSLYHQRMMLGDCRLETGNYSFPVIARGCMPSDCVCLSLMAYGSEVTRYNMASVSGNELLIYPEGAELLYHSDGPARWINYAIPREMLQQAIINYSGKSIAISQDRITSLQLDEGEVEKLIKLTDEIFTIGQTHKQSGVSSRGFTQLSDTLLNSYVAAICDAHGVGNLQAKKSLISQRHNNLILDSEYFVMSHDDMNTSLISIAQRTGYSLRALELIFRNSVGMPPGKWFLNMRLNGALRDLLMATANCSVSSIATRWGFQHLSRFSEQYRKTFGEYPSHTLVRNRRAFLDTVS